MDIVINAVDKASPVINKIKGTTGQTTGFMEKNWKKVGLVTAGVATAFEMLYQKQKPLIEQTKKIANAMDMTEEAMRNLAIETSNVTFPLNEVLDLMELGRQQGIKSAEGLKEYASFWDTVGDATGESSGALGKAGAALRAVGVAAGEEKESLAALGYIFQETSGSVADFLRFLDRSGPELREMGMGVNDAAAMLGYMEHELGMSARVARTEFATAVSTADGNVELLYETLGISEEQFGKYSKAVEESSTVIQENADIHAEMFSPIDKIKHAISELTFKLSPYIEKMAQLAPALYAVGPAMKLFSLGAKGIQFVMSGQLIPTLVAATTKVWAFTAAIFANPITWWILGIMAVIAAIVLLWKNWDKITEWISRKIDWIVDKFQWLGDKVKWVAEKLGIYKEKTDEIVGSTEDLKEATEGAGESIDELKTKEEEALAAADALTEENEGLATSLDTVGDKAIKASDNIKIYAEDIAENYIQLAGRAADSWDDFYAFWEAEAKRTAEEIKKVNKEVEASTPKAKKSNLYKIVDAEGNTIGIQSGNILSKEAKEEGVTLVKMHEGGVVNTAIPGGEGAVLLQDNEVVRTPEQEAELMKPGETVNTTTIKLEIKEGAFQYSGNQIDEKSIRKSGKIIFDELITQCRANNIILQGV